MSETENRETIVACLDAVPCAAQYVLERQQEAPPPIFQKASVKELPLATQEQEPPLISDSSEPEPHLSRPSHLEPSTFNDSLQTHSASSNDTSVVDSSGSVSPFTEPDTLDFDSLGLGSTAYIGSKSAIEGVIGLYAENILAKVSRTATKSLIGERRFPDYFPEYVPQEGDDAGNYSLREADFWTCGFFPGTLFSLLERTIRFPWSIRVHDTDSISRDGISIENIRLHLHTLCDTWARPLHGMASRTDTHDIGFIVMPALRLDWELRGNVQSLNSIICAARSLVTRYVPSAGVIRSWDLLLKNNMEIRDQTENAIVIIDSLCNLDLLYYAAQHSSDGRDLYDMATTHAKTLLRSHLRDVKPEPTSRDSYAGSWYSTCHVANIDPRSGELKERLTHQGYDNNSTWARGQAWGILGYAQTYMATKDETFLWAACGLTEYFIYRLETAPECVAKGSRYVPLWDFDAPIEDPSSPLRDSSAGAIAANGMLVLSQGLAAAGKDELAARYRRIAVAIVQELLDFAQAPEKARLIKGTAHTIEVEDETLQVFDGILKFGTANNNQFSKKRYANHGLVYGDYYLVEFGNRLLRMGLI